jgi:AcrR family transcriptional regulator
MALRARIDGIETRQRILRAAGEVFAERGFREATVAGICRRAGANAAAINYHFKDKESLYVEVWRQAAQEAVNLYPIDGGIRANAPARDRLRGFLIALLQRMTDRGRLGQFHRLRLMEMANPTGLIHGIRWKALQPMRTYIQSLLRELLGPEGTEEELNFCEFNLVGPCLMAQMTVQSPPAGRPFLPSVEVMAFADHCADFVLAGIKSLRAKRRNAKG